jgi:hypothetical protein
MKYNKESRLDVTFLCAAAEAAAAAAARVSANYRKGLFSPMFFVF